MSFNYYYDYLKQKSNCHNDISCCIIGPTGITGPTGPSGGPIEDLMEETYKTSF